MKKLILAVFLAGAFAGALFAFRWLRGETAYEEAVHELEAEPSPVDAPAPGDRTT